MSAVDGLPVEDRQTFLNEDMVLKVRPADPKVWDPSPYEPFLDLLCGHRDFQRRAILTTLDYLLGKRYPSLRELALQNFEKNSELQRRWSRFDEFCRHLQMPDQLSCSLDLATGTGKSYVMYGIAAILLAEGAVEKVLVLCPSTTIESGLLDKFQALSSSSELEAVMPAAAVIRVPSITKATKTVVNGAICVENYHAVLQHVGSSVDDSFSGIGGKVAVLNDEAHHVANEAGTAAGRWKEFLTSPKFDFRYIVGLSGTCYVGNSYFTDVISRYSLRQAMEENVVKKVDYVSDGPVVSGQQEKWQLVWKKHDDNARRLASRKIRPLTIVVAESISSAKRVYEDLVEWLCEWETLDVENATRKVLVVTSHSDHRANVIALRNVDSSASPVEWIVSVSMLSEGWDVKNVFQIVPHEERAFRSKLLISQVLGRGLRKPDGWEGEPPVVSVFNHDSWSKRIQGLVNEVLEIERRLTSIVRPTSDFNFEIHNIRYGRIANVTEHPMVGEYRLFEKGYVVLPSQVVERSVSVVYEQAGSGKVSRFDTILSEKTYSTGEVAEQLYLRLKSIDDESVTDPVPENHTDYSRRFTREVCLRVVSESLQRAGVTDDRVTDDNRQRLLQAIGPLRRKAAKRIVYELSADALEIIHTSDRPKDSCSASELRRATKSIFYTDDTMIDIRLDQRDFFNEVSDQFGEFPGAAYHVVNDADFKTPSSFAIADAGPEKRFIGSLVQRQNAQIIDRWIKNSSTGFYSIEYAWKKGEHPKRGEFNPDFFIIVGDNMHIVEIKHDDEILDPAPDNIKKHEYAVRHIGHLNTWLERDGINRRYFFNMLAPKDFGAFFQKLRDGTLPTYRSTLDATMINA